MSRVPPHRRSSRLFLLALAAALGACGDDAAAKAREAALRDEFRADIDKVRGDADKLSKSLQAERDERRALRGEVDLLSKRVTDLEARPADGPATAGAAPETSGKGPANDKDALLAEMKALQEKVFSGKATDEEQQRFWELARSASVVDELMKTLEAKVKDHPEDAGARMQLAESYIAKLLSIPGGPEQGIWSMKAEGQWQEVLKKDPDHWDARYSLAFNWSMWPDFLNKTPDAVREFEKLREVQERQGVDEKHAQTYLQLSRLYQKQNKAEKATDVLRAGLSRHPDDAELRKALDSLQD